MPDEIIEKNRKHHDETYHEYSFEEALNFIGFGKVQIIITLVSGILLMAVINETMGMMIVGIASQCDLKMNSQMKGLLAGISYIGILISSHLWGYLADTIGRRKVIMYTMFGCNLLTLISSFIENYWIFLIFRLFSGIFISGPSATTYAYLGEFHNTKFRPITISFASTFVGIATAYIPAIGWLILPSNWEIPIYDGFSYRPWRLLLLLYYTLPGFIGALCLLKLPESPKFSLSQNNEAEALKTLEWIYRKNNKNSMENFPIKKLLSETNLEDKIHFKKSPFDIIKSVFYQTIPLFKRPYLINFTICCIIQFGLFLCSSGMGLWYPEIKNRLSYVQDGDHLAMCTIIESYSEKFILNSNATEICNDDVNTEAFVANIILGLLFIVGYIILAFIINPIGRKIILPIVLFASGISGFLLHWIYQPEAIVVLFSLFLMCAGLCVSIVNGAVVDLIPTHLRGMAICISLMVGRLGSVVGSNLIGALLEVDCPLTFSLFAGFITICAILALLLP